MPDSVDPPSLVSAVRSAWPPGVWGPVHVAVAVSGGADSMALLICLLKLRQESNAEGLLFALHVDHQLRGEAASADADWFMNECRSLGIRSEVLSPPTPPTDADLSDGVEAYARRTRYGLLGRACERLGARYLATGHTADDQSETVLLRILRGSGLRGAAGIPFTRPITPSVSVVRPLLGCSREAVLEYLAQQGQGYREDETNNDLTFRRNLIRREWLPRLVTAFPDAPDALRRLAEQCREAQEVIDGLADRLLSTCDHRLMKGGGFSLLTGPLITADEPVAREALRMVWRSSGLSEQGMTRWWWCELSLLARERGQGVLAMPGDLRASIEADRLVLRPASG